jgi:hypothetical protein
MDASVDKFITDFKGRVEMKVDLPAQKVVEVKK